jgi:hypothetical protein
MANTSITIVQTSGGSGALINGAAVGEWGRQVTLRFTPNPGYELAGIDVDGNAIPKPTILTGGGDSGQDFCSSDADCNRDPNTVNERRCNFSTGLCEDIDLRET